MSQEGILDVLSSHPSIPTTFMGNVGTATPVLNELNIFGAAVLATAIPVQTVASGNTLTVDVQYASASASSLASQAGIASFNSAQFTVDSNGFVSLTAPTGTEAFIVQKGTSPVTPSAGLITFSGAAVAAGINPVQTDGTGAHTMTLEVQISQAIAASDATKVGLATFNSANFTVDGNGFVSLIGGAAPIEKINLDTGTSPIVPTAGVITLTAGTVAAGTNPIRTDGTAASTAKIEVQISQAIAAADATKIGLSNYNSAQFTVAATGFVSLIGSSTNPPILGVHPNATSGAGTDPTVADASGNISILAARVAAGTNPIRSVATAANSITVQAQISQAIAATDATKIGLANFDSASFAVDANGFVTAAGGGLGKTITGDSGGALSPSSGNWNILGLSGSKTSGSGSTLTIKSPPFSQVGGAGTSVLNTGEIVTAAVTRTLPASAGLADGDLFIYVCTTAGALVIQAVGAQKIRIGSGLSSAAGTATSNAIGDSVTLRFDATQGFFLAVSVIGTWTLA